MSGRQLLLANDDVRICFAAPRSGSGLYRNSTGNEAVYLRTGAARFESVYGALDAAAGDYGDPAGHHPPLAPGRQCPGRQGPGRHCPGQRRGAPFTEVLVIEARGHIRPPRRYLSQYGQFLEHAPYCERDLRGPDGPLLDGEDQPVLVRHRDGLSLLTYARHPFDVVGWDGCLYPYAFNIADFEPIVKRTHAPPPVHQTFEGPNFVICSFCPRPLDFDAESVPVLDNHHNVDSDEMMFYVGGDYTARKGSGSAWARSPFTRPASPTGRSPARSRPPLRGCRRDAPARTKRRS